MPQLVKGGKHVFGWSHVGDAGRIIVPPEAVDEYQLKESQELILLPGSKTSGGFGLGSPESVKRTPLGVVADVHPELGKFRVPEGEIIEYKGKPYCWVEL